MGRVFSFKKQLAYGSRKEAEFERLFGDVLERMDGYIADFRIKGTDLTLDIKADTYDPKKTPNFFMERYSYDDKNGGPWQALDKGVQYYVYYFPKNGSIFAFETAKLVKALEKIEADLRLVKIFNTSHVTRGYIVPRAALDHITLTLEQMLEGAYK